MPLFPEYKCFGFLVVTTLSASLTLIECLKDCLLIFLANLINSSGTARMGWGYGTYPSLLPYDIALNLDWDLIFSWTGVMVLAFSPFSFFVFLVGAIKASFSSILSSLSDRFLFLPTLTCNRSSSPLNALDFNLS